MKKDNGGVQYPLAPHPQDINLFNPIKQIERDWDCWWFELFLRMWWDATPLYQKAIEDLDVGPEDNAGWSPWHMKISSCIKIYCIWK